MASSGLPALCSFIGIGTSTGLTSAVFCICRACELSKCDFIVKREIQEVCSSEVVLSMETLKGNIAGEYLKQPNTLKGKWR